MYFGGDDTCNGEVAFYLFYNRIARNNTAYGFRNQYEVWEDRRLVDRFEEHYKYSAMYFN